MPMVITPSQTPAGKPYLRLVSSGDVSASDADGFTRAMSPGGAHAGLSILAVVEDGAKYSPEARQAFMRSNTPGVDVKPVAVVVKSAPLRVMLSFIIKMSSAGGNTKFFGTEADGLAWLEQQLSAPPGGLQRA